MPQRPATVATPQTDRPAFVEQASTTGVPLDWTRSLESVGAARSFHYRSNAERAAAQAGAASPAEQRTTEGELKRRTAKAAKTDCRTAHASMGLLALPMLAYDALKDSTCRW
jgi:hypothetical protein